MPNYLLPFGPPEGTRDEIDITQDFIEFDANRFGAGIGNRYDNDTRVRVIVGAKGSGKTVYLKRLQAKARNLQGVYADPIIQAEIELPSTNAIVQFHSLYDPEIIIEVWGKLWYSVIMSSLLSYILYEPTLRNSMSANIVAKLESNLPPFFPFKVPTTVYSFLSQVLKTYTNHNSVEKYLNDTSWPTILTLIRRNIDRLPPLYFFLDSVDNLWPQAPMHWLKCQEGLFYTTINLLKDGLLGGRLHINVCIRDHVLASVLQTANQTKYRNEPHIRILDWGYEAIEYLLLKKIQGFPDDFLMIPTQRKSNPIKAWLGRETIQNKVRGIEESVSQYLIRHTRLSPRDIIHMGNELTQHVLVSKLQNRNYVSDTLIRKTVSSVAVFLANEQIEICVNQIGSLLIPRSSGRRGHIEIYNKLPGIADNIERIIKLINKDRFGLNELLYAVEEANKVVPEVDMFSVLWQNRLIGYVNNVDLNYQNKFFSERFMDDFDLSMTKSEYLFHSILVDKFDIQPIGIYPPTQWEVDSSE